MSRRLVRRTIAGIVVVAAIVAGVVTYSGAATSYRVNAVFPSAQGLFAGATVRMLGVAVGTVDDVHYHGGVVDVTMSIDDSQTLPATVHADLISPLLLGQPDVELSPGYVGGPILARGGTIPESRTAVPVSTDELLRQLQRVLGSVKDASLHDLVGNLASDLAGQGSQLHQLISAASGTLQLLAQKGTQLGHLNGSLAQLTGTLKDNENQLVSLIDDYETVSGVIASHQQALGAAIGDLSTASAQLAKLLTPNFKPLVQDVDVVTTAGRTLDRNLSNLDGVLSSSRSLFAAAHRAYDPQYQWINLNNQLAPGLTTDVVEGLVRDRLAGICRRVLAHHSSGLSSAEKKTLATCGNPDSGYFNPILSQIPTLLASSGLDNPGGSPTASTGAGSSSGSVGSLLGPGLKKIPGLSSAERQEVGSAGGNSK